MPKPTDQTELTSGVSAEFVQKIRVVRGLTRGQIARRLKTSPTVVYNWETARTRIPLSAFFVYLRAARHDPADTLGRHVFSIKTISEDPASLLGSFRSRLRWSQKQLALALGYKGPAIIHHFEKGLREPDLTDFLRVMALAKDNVRGLVAEVTGDQEFASRFPEGKEALQADWREYWAHYYISAIRQIMRTDTYRDLARYKRGYFAEILGISDAEERHALEVLKSFDLIRWEKAKPLINPSVQIIVPRLPKEELDALKLQWLDFGKKRYLADETGRNMLTVDTFPVNAELMDKIVGRIRDLQDEFHNLAQKETDGFVHLGWLATYVSAG